ncbi:MAG TPA: hypothetical protein VF690_05680 [Hymenobacter sp.]
MLLALGFTGTRADGLLTRLSVERDERGNVRASETTYQTNQPNMFVSSDMRRGQSLAVRAISSGANDAQKFVL